MLRGNLSNRFSSLHSSWGLFCKRRFKINAFPPNAQDCNALACTLFAEVTRFSYLRSRSVICLRKELCSTKCSFLIPLSFSMFKYPKHCFLDQSLHVRTIQNDSLVVRGCESLPIWSPSYVSKLWWKWLIGWWLNLWMAIARVIPTF